MWLNPASLNQIGIAVSVGYDDGFSGNGYSVGISENNTQTGNHLTAIFGSAGVFSGGYTFQSTNQWYQVVMLRDSGVTTFYVNGGLTLSGVTTTPIAPTAFTIGSENGVRFFNGAIDDVRIYNRALSSNEVAALYAFESTPQAPYITTQPANFTTNAFLTASFTVVAGGTPPLSYQWYQNSNALTDGGVISGSTTSNLTFSSASAVNAGIYTVTITNVSGSVTSSNALLAIIPLTSIINTAPTATAIVYGQTLASSTLINGAASTVGAFIFTNPRIAPNAGTTNVAVTFTPADTNNYTSVATNVNVTVNQASGTVTLANLAQTYSGSAISASATTTPANLKVTLTYNGSVNTPTNAGSYTVIGTINDANYAGSGTNTLVISKASGTVNLANLAQTYTGSAISASVTTTPANLNVTLTYNGSVNAPTNAGSYTVIGTINGANYAGSGTNTLVIGKASGTVILANLAQTYTGSAISTSVTTTPANLTVNLTYNGSVNAPTNVGSYTVIGTINEVNYAGSQTNTLVISQATGVVVLGSLNQVYDGTGKAATASTSPTTLNVTLTYNGNANAPTNVGSYTVIGTINDANYAGSRTNTLVIGQAGGTVILANLAQIYTSGAISANATTTPTNLTVNLTYNGNVNAPTNAGSYTVVGMINDANYQGTATNTLVINKAAAVATIGNLFQIYDGVAKLVNISTLPPGLAAAFTYNGSVNAPTNAGSYTVIGNISDANYQGSATSTLVVSKATSTVALGSLSQIYDGTGKMATAMTAPEGLAVAFTYNGSPNAPTNAGSYTVIGTINDANYQGSSTNTLVISPAGSVITQAPTATAIVYGETLASSTLSNGLASTGGAFSFTSPGIAPNAGTTNVSVTFTPFNTNDYNRAITNVVVVVNKALGTVVLSNLAQVYNGTARVVTAGTTPTNLPVSFTFNGSPTAPTNAGNYTVIGTINDANYQGNATSSLVVYPASPTILQQPTNQTVARGITVNFNVSVVGTLPLHYQWRSNLLNIASATNSTLTLNNVQTNATAGYRVVITNSSGSVTSSVAQLDVFLQSVPLTLIQTGLGTITGATNNQVLIIGNNYTVTATPATGFKLTNWTSNLLPTTNIAALTFLMQSNLSLTANFIDTNRPTLSITNLTAGQRWSNQVFTARGTAADNWQIASVQYQLNSGIWTNATGTTNWSAPLTSTPGTNTLAAYATDTTGNNSATNSVSWQYVVTNMLSVQPAGLGTLTPNYSNAWLEIGRNYNMTATPATGFVVTNWTVSTNWLGGRITNNATVQFMMASNLTLQVNFADVTKPTLTVSSPANNAKMSNALATVSGTAADNWKVSGVWYQVNSNPWNLVSTTNNYTNWSQTLPLVIGTNTLKAYALDLGGNFSTTNILSVVSSNTFLLQLAFTNSLPNATNGMAFTLQLSKGLNGHIQVSSNLIDWSTLTNFVGTNSTLTIRDPSAANSPRRFYRAVTP